MQTPRLLIRKAMMNIQGRTRPCVQVQASIDPRIQAVLQQHFLTENLFKRSMYQSGFPAGVPTPSPSLAPHLGNFIRNDACPELTVKTILAGQLYQASSIWEVMAFEYVAMRAFDALVEMMVSVSALGSETEYRSPLSEVAAFAADMAIDMAVAPAAVAPGAPGLANAA